jgi:hypothetical protein
VQKLPKLSHHLPSPTTWLRWYKKIRDAWERYHKTDGEEPAVEVKVQDRRLWQLAVEICIGVLMCHLVSLTRVELKSRESFFSLE